MKKRAGFLPPPSQKLVLVCASSVFSIPHEDLCWCVHGSMRDFFWIPSGRKEAKRLLQENKDCIYRIADQVGFKSPCYFSKVFKELEGRSPKEYRGFTFSEMEGRKKKHRISRLQ